MKKTILGLILIGTYLMANENAVLSYKIEKNNEVIHSGNIVSFTKNYSRANYDKKGFLRHECSKYGTKTTRTIGTEILIFNDSYSLDCLNDTKTSSQCNLIIYNAKSNDELVKTIADNKECKSYRPKQLKKEYKFKVHIGQSNEIILDENYKFSYKNYITN